MLVGSNCSDFSYVLFDIRVSLLDDDLTCPRLGSSIEMNLNDLRGIVVDFLNNVKKVATQDPNGHISEDYLRLYQEHLADTNKTIPGGCRDLQQASLTTTWSELETMTNEIVNAIYSAQMGAMAPKPKRFWQR